MDQPVVSIERIDEKQLLSLISTAGQWLVFMGPGVSKLIAEAIVERWHMLGSQHVKVILDADPEVARLGYGDVNGLEVLQNEARDFGMVVNHQPGLRIGLVITDRSTHVFAPTPLLIEAGSFNNLHLNSVSLDFVPPSLLRDLGLGENGPSAQSIGNKEISPEQITRVSQDLQKNPPVKFDVARTLRVFNAHFEFVELELKGTQLAQKVVPIQNDLMGLAQEEQIKKMLHARFQIINNNGPLSDNPLKQIKDYIVRRYLISLPNYGSVVLREKKDEFLGEVDILKEKVKEYQQNIEESLQAEMDKNRSDLVRALLPAVLKQPPERLLPIFEFEIRDKVISENLDIELKKAFGTASELISKMLVRVVFKGVTYELLNEPKFVATARKALPTLDMLHNEFSVAQGQGT